MFSLKEAGYGSTVFNGRVQTDQTTGKAGTRPSASLLSTIPKYESKRQANAANKHKRKAVAPRNYAMQPPEADCYTK